jgi:hypothetical protein
MATASKKGAHAGQPAVYSNDGVGIAREDKALIADEEIPLIC